MSMVTVTFVSVLNRYIGHGTVTEAEFGEIIDAINDGQRIVKLDDRFGSGEKYVPVSQIAEIQVER